MKRLVDKRSHKLTGFLLGMMCLTACAPGGQEYVDAFVAPEPDLMRLRICHGYGCANITEVGISDQAWSRVAAVFVPAPTNAVDERSRIADGVALVETLVGPITGIDADEGRSTLFPADEFQLDCIDETVNTTTVLRAMEQRGLLSFHRVGAAARRGYFLNGWPHNTAVIEEIATDQPYTVDSWFHANGERPEIVPLELWLTGWSPDEPA